MTTQKTYFGGLPTDVDVRALRDKFGVPAEGQPIPYADVAESIHVGVNTNRFRTVTSAWRRSLWREHGLVTVGYMGAFIVAPPAKRVDVASGKLTEAVRRARKAFEIASGTDASRLTTEQRAKNDHTKHVSSSTLQHARLEAKRYQPRLTEATA